MGEGGARRSTWQVGMEIQQCRGCGMRVPASLERCLNCGWKTGGQRGPRPRVTNLASRAKPPTYRPPVAAPVRTAAAPAAVHWEDAPPRFEPTITDDSHCAVCGRGPATKLRLVRWSGLLFPRSGRVTAPFCRYHGEAAASEYLRRTLIEGWWALFAWMLNPLAIATDRRARTLARRLDPPVGEIDPRYARPLPEDVQAAVTETADERAERREVSNTVKAAIGIGFLGLVALPVTMDLSNESAARIIGAGLVATMFVYASVGVMLLYRFRRTSVRPSVERGVAGPAVIGLLIGAAAGLVIAGLLSLAHGAPTSDGALLAVFAEGGTGAIWVTVFIAVLAAPFVEETLFRGLLAESLRSRGRSPAVFAAAVAFSVWHLNPSSLSYYVLVGFLLGVVYWRLGLAGSIGAHLAFNAVLVVFAAYAMSGGGVVTGPTGVSTQLPGGWHQLEAGGPVPASADLAAESVAGATFLVVSYEPQAPPGIVQPLVLFLEPQQFPPGATNLTTATVSGAVAQRFTVVQQGLETDVVFVPWGPRAYEVHMIDAGSETAERQLEAMLGSLVLPAV